MKNIILFVVNPSSHGGALKEEWLAAEWRITTEVKHVIGQHFETEIFFTTPEMRGAEKVRESLRAGCEHIVLVGGDGTLSQGVQGLFEGLEQVNPDACLYVIPGGRGNDFFKSLSGCRSGVSPFEQGLKLLKKGCKRKVDLIRLTWLNDVGHALEAPYYCLNLASFGYSTQVVRRVVRREGWIGKSILGKSAWTYFLQSFSTMAEYRPIEVSMKADGIEVFQGPLYAGFVLNSPYHGGGICWSQKACIDDGVLNWVTISFASVLDALKSLPRLVPGMLKGEWEMAAAKSSVREGSAKNVELMLLNPAGKNPDGNRAAMMNPLSEVDGDLVEPPGTRGVRLEIMPNALTVWR